MPHLEAGPIFEGQLFCALLASADGKFGVSGSAINLLFGQRREMRSTGIFIFFLEYVDYNKG